MMSASFPFGHRLLQRRCKKNLRMQLCRHWKKSPASKQTVRGRRMKEINGRMKQLKAEMEDISKEQESIRNGQKEVREKFEAIETECQQLRRDTQLIAQQSASTKLRLVIMFQILRARENNDFATATDLTRILREMIARNRQK